jgi:hypothetical protein
LASTIAPGLAQSLFGEIFQFPHETVNSRFFPGRFSEPEKTKCWQHQQYTPIGGGVLLILDSAGISINNTYS